MFLNIRKAYFSYITPEITYPSNLCKKNPYEVYSFGVTVSSISRRKAGGAAVSSFVLLNINIQAIFKTN